MIDSPGVGHPSLEVLSKVSYSLRFIVPFLFYPFVAQAWVMA